MKLGFCRIRGKCWFISDHIAFTVKKSEFKEIQGDLEHFQEIFSAFRVDFQELSPAKVVRYFISFCAIFCLKWLLY